VSARQRKGLSLRTSPGSFSLVPPGDAYLLLRGAPALHCIPLRPALLATAAAAYTSPANIKFRSMMDRWKPDYCEAPPPEKKRICRQLLSMWRELEPAGRFVKTARTAEGDEQVVGRALDDAESKRVVQTYLSRTPTLGTTRRHGIQDADVAVAVAVAAADPMRLQQQQQCLGSDGPASATARAPSQPRPGAERRELETEYERDPDVAVDGNDPDGATVDVPLYLWLQGHLETVAPAPAAMPGRPSSGGGHDDQGFDEPDDFDFDQGATMLDLLLEVEEPATAGHQSEGGGPENPVAAAGGSLYQPISPPPCSGKAAVPPEVTPEDPLGLFLHGSAWHLWQPQQQQEQQLQVDDGGDRTWQGQVRVPSQLRPAGAEVISVAPVSLSLSHTHTYPNSCGVVSLRGTRSPTAPQTFSAEAGDSHRSPESGGRREEKGGGGGGEQRPNDGRLGGRPGRSWPHLRRSLLRRLLRHLLRRRPLAGAAPAAHPRAHAHARSASRPRVRVRVRAWVPWSLVPQRVTGPTCHSNKGPSPSPHPLRVVPADPTPCLSQTNANRLLS
jgi:hypothetical protein